MELMRGVLSSISCSRSNVTNKEMSFFLKNGSNLLKEHIAQWNGRSKTPLRNFSAKEIAKATNNFSSSDLVSKNNFYSTYRGSFQEWEILVKKYRCYGTKNVQLVESYAVNDILVSSQMSFHKNALKLLGYCLDFEYPALIYQCPEAYDSLFFTEEVKLTWENTLIIASDIANVLVYLHTGFRTPFIHRNMNLRNFVIDKNGTAKLADFSFCIQIPLGECQVEDDVMGSYMYVEPVYDSTGVMGTYMYVDPVYVSTGVLTEKGDVYNIGVVLFELFTGKKGFDMLHSGEFSSLFDLLKSYIESDEVENIVKADMVIEGETGQIEQFRSFASLALKCLQKERDNRPEMIEVVKELRRIQSLSTS